MTISNSVKQEAVFIGANKQSYVADYHKTSKLVAYGASNTIALWNPLAEDNQGVYHTLKQHTKEVTCVKFLENTPFLVSTAEDSQINIWREQRGGSYILHQSISYHEHSLTCLAVCDERLFVTGSADGYVALWGYSKQDDGFKLVFEFQVKLGFYPLALALQDIDAHGNYVLAISGTTMNVYIYSFQLCNNDVANFHQAAVMTGHEDWIKCLSFVAETKHKNYILASGGQDRYIRLWRLRLNELIDDSDEDESRLTLLSNKQYKFTFHGPNGENRAAFNFEALIMGHDDWVTGLQWHPSFVNNLPNKRLQLLSSSADTGLMIWEMDQDSGIWCCVNRLGEMSIKGASTATGASGGFWSCLWFVDGASQQQYILANGKTGSFRVYKNIDEEAKSFESTMGVTGATKEVTDVVWSRNGEYFVTTSLDQTTRLFAPWVNNRDHKTWHEFARPQIHGYDMICLDFIDNTKFVSGGDEKILRVFETTNSISALLKSKCNIDVATNDEALPEAASLPVLGLSNKAANEAPIEDDQAAEQQNANTEENGAGMANDDDILLALSTPPLEDHLQRYTLFPEVEKLYGHGYEIVCAATSPSGRLIASSCRSNSAKHAVIRIYDAHQDYKQLEHVLEGHTLTITSLEFSPDGKFLLGVSRDRSFTLWRVVDEVAGKFELVELKEKAHTRIIWDCSWIPSSNGEYFFVTGSRDKQLKLWQVRDKVEMVASIKLTDAITSVSCYQGSLLGDNQAVIATGSEGGAVEIHSVNLKGDSLALETRLRVQDDITPSNRVAKLSFSHKLHEDSKVYLGVASNDTSARVYSIETSALV